MRIPQFEMERFQSLHENDVSINLSESGVHPLSIREILSEAQIDTLLNTSLTYGYTSGTPELSTARLACRSCCMLNDLFGRCQVCG